MAKKGHLYIGPAGWSYDDWKGIVYPERKPKGFEPLVYMARFFNTVEINSSFYRIPSTRSTEKWARLVEPIEDFQFSVKAWNEFTHLREDIDREALKEWHRAMEPLRKSDRLGAVLIQFPWSFRRTPENARYLETLAGALEPDPIAIEVRHSSWLDDEYFAWLREKGYSFANIDQPLFNDSIPPTDYVTSPIAYVRFHGRNYQNWFRENADVAERYRYLYSKPELEEWVDRIKKIIKKAERVFVIGNNHTEGRGVANGLELKAMLSGKKVEAPPPLPNLYPELAEFVKESESESNAEKTTRGEQLSLFQ